MSASPHKITLVLKRLFYPRGEPYRVGARTLRYLPGTRPVRLRYATSPDRSARYDALQVRLFSTALAEGDSAIDVGAHCGQYSILMAAMCGKSGHVVAFEPDPYARARLLENIGLNPDVKPPVVESCAVSDRSGKATLFSRNGNSQSSLVRSGVEFRPGDRSERIRVDVVSLDAYLAERRLTPRWVKIDAEGAEIRILKGAKGLLSSSSGIVCELHPYAWSEFGSTLGELKEVVAASGRRIRYLDEHAAIGDRVEYGTVLLERLP